MISEPMPLFEWLRLVAEETGRGKLSRQLSAVATLTGLDSNGTSGDRVRVHAAVTAARLDLSERQVWRHFRALVAGGWFEQTRKPARGNKGRPGRVAEYQLTVPLAYLSDDLAAIRLTIEGGAMSDVKATDGAKRLTSEPQSSDVAERANGTVFPSDVIPPFYQVPLSTQDRARETKRAVR